MTRAARHTYDLASIGASPGGYTQPYQRYGAGTIERPHHTFEALGDLPDSSRVPVHVVTCQVCDE